MKPVDFEIVNDWLSSVEPGDDDFVALDSITKYAYLGVA